MTRTLAHGRDGSFSKMTRAGQCVMNRSRMYGTTVANTVEDCARNCGKAEKTLQHRQLRINPESGVDDRDRQYRLVTDQVTTMTP